MRGHVRRSIAFFMSALVVIAAALSGCSKSADDLYAEGKQLMQEENSFDRAVEVLASFREQFPDDPRMPEIELALATGYQSRGRFDEAVERYRYLIETFPGAIEAYKGEFLLGYMYYEIMDDTTRATEVLNEFIAAYPDSDLTESAKILVENMGVPLEDWSVVRSLEGAGR